MSYFIIIRGPAGVGKTIIARKLAKLLHAYHISIDSILAKHNLDDLDYVSGNLCIPEHKMLAANRIIIPMAQKKLAADQIVIFDGNFYHKSQIENLLTQLKFPHFVYTLKADLKVCLTRNKRRTHPLDDQAVRDVFELVSKFNYGIVVDTNRQTTDETVSEIAKQKG